MAGFFGLFGKKKDEPKGAFFLDPDESKSYGDIEYMRASKTIRRTFVKTVGNPEGGESIKQVSANKAVKRDANEAKRITPKTINNSSSSSVGNSNNSESARPQLKTDSNMDMFRNMAKKIRK